MLKEAAIQNSFASQQNAIQLFLPLSGCVSEQEPSYSSQKTKIPPLQGKPENAFLCKQDIWAKGRTEGIAHS